MQSVTSLDMEFGRGCDNIREIERRTNNLYWEAVIWRVQFAGQQGDRKKEECQRGGE